MYARVECSVGRPTETVWPSMCYERYVPGSTPTLTALRRWVEALVLHMTPARTYWCDGSLRERNRLEAQLVRDRVWVSLSKFKHLHGFLQRSGPNPPAASVANSRALAAQLWQRLNRALAGRPLFVVPYLLGSPESARRQVGVELTDSLETVLSIRAMSRMGKLALERAREDSPIVRSVHISALGRSEPISVCDPERLELCTLGTNSYEDSVLSAHRHAVELASLAERDGCLVARMALIALRPPRGERRYFAVALPAGSGKTEVAMMAPSLPGWQVETLGDDVCWLYPGSDGRLWAMNPNRGVSMLSQGITSNSSPHLIASLRREVIFTDVALREDGGVWWEGQPPPPAEIVEDWCGRQWTAEAGLGAAHPRARVTLPLSSCVTANATLRDEIGVPLSALVFGARRAEAEPLVLEAKGWRHGMLLALTMSSDDGTQASAQCDPLGLRRVHELSSHIEAWVATNRRLRDPPRCFRVNWFLRGDRAVPLWPGFGDNIRVFKWIYERIEGRVGAHETAVGLTPTRDTFDARGLPIPEADVARLLSVDAAAHLEAMGISLNQLGASGINVPRPLTELHAQFGRSFRKALS